MKSIVNQCAVVEMSRIEFSIWLFKVTLLFTSAVLGSFYNIFVSSKEAVQLSLSLSTPASQRPRFAMTVT